jgi:hypothetical protein
MLFMRWNYPDAAFRSRLFDSPALTMRPLIPEERVKGAHPRDVEAGPSIEKSALH